MKCQEAKHYLSMYVDGELDSEEMMELEYHFKYCPACQKTVKFEHWFKKNIKKAIPEFTAPMNLKRSIKEAISAERRREIPLAMKLTPVLAMAVVVLVVLLFPKIEVHSPIVEAAVDTHSQELPMDVTSENYDEVKQFLQPRVNFAISIPRFTRPDIHLAGARLSRVYRSTAANLTFVRGLKRYTVLVSNDQDNMLLPKSPELRNRRIGNREIMYTQRAGYNVYVWRNKKLIYSLVSDDSEPEIEKLITTADLNSP